MKEIFDTKLRLSSHNKGVLQLVNSILEEYVADGYTLTLRQLYYQLVSRDIIPNSDKEYKKLGNLIKKGRMSGVVDWSAIEDRIRKPRRPYWVHGIEDAISDTVQQYRLDRMKGQDKNIEVWVEKDALSAVLSRVTEKYHVRLMVNRGYSSASAMYAASKRLNSGDIILYFGDHDPSGLDMIRDVRDRLYEFGRDIDVKAVALTMDQIKKFNPPKNPAKITDARAKSYIAEYGRSSWELDALPPKELIDLCEQSILEEIDIDKYARMVEQEKIDISIMKAKFGIDG